MRSCRQIGGRVAIAALMLITAFVSSGCRGESSSGSANGTGESTASHAPSEPATTTAVAEIAERAVPLGASVTLVGYCRGWDLLGEVEHPPPATKSDWVLKDRSGAIYIQAADLIVVASDGSTETSFSPYGPDKPTRLVEVAGRVQEAPDGSRFVRPSEIRLIDETD